jgi:hypothetical protein
VSAPGDYDNGEIGGMIGRENRRTRRKTAPVPLCPPQTPHAARARTRAAAVGSQRLTAELRHGHTASYPLVPGVKRQGREANHSPPSSAEVKNGGALSLHPTSSWLGA